MVEPGVSSEARVSWVALVIAAIFAAPTAALLAARTALPGWAIALVVLAMFAATYPIATRVARRRRRVAKSGLGPAERAVLEEWVEFYRTLAPEGRQRFETEMAIFLDEQTITAPRGAPLELELRVLVAASAITLIFGRPGFRYPRLRDIVVYDRAFNEEYEEHDDADILGMVHAQGPILLSARSLRAGFRGEHDGQNVGYHEFAHVLDFDRGDADGVPGFMPWAGVRPWLDAMHEEMERIEHHRSVLRRYATKNQAEFFAVATEMFFERPAHLERAHPELYALLVEAYGQDPLSHLPDDHHARRHRVTTERATE